MKFTFSAVLAVALAPACVQTHTLRKLAEYKYTEDLECQPEFCVDIREKCQLTSITGGWRTQFAESYCFVDLTSQGDTEITCTEECIPPPPPSGTVYTYTADMQCQPELCANFDALCAMTAGTGAVEYTFSDTFCSVAFTGIAELTCSEECIPPPPPDGPVYKYYENMECQAAFCAALFNNECQLTAGSGDVNVLSDGTTCSVGFSGTGLELTCSQECINPAPQNIGTPASPQDTGSYEYPNDSDANLEMYCQVELCDNFGTICTLSSSDGAYTSFRYNTLSNSTSCKVVVRPENTVTCSQECIDPASPQDIGTPASPQDSGSFEHWNDSFETISMPCQVDFCNNFGSICTITGDGAYTNCGSQASTTDQCLDDCKLVLFPGSRATCTEECVSPEDDSAVASNQPTYGDPDEVVRMECEWDFCSRYREICNVSSEGTAFTLYNFQDPTSDCNLVVSPGTSVTCTEECVAPASTE